MIRSIALAALTVSMFYLPRVEAHNVWLLPSSTVLSKAQYITVDAAVSNDLFFFNHVPLALDNLQIRDPEGNVLAAENVHKGKLRSVFDLHVQKPGTYQLSVLNKGLMANYVLNGEKKRWRGSEQRFAEEVPKGAKDLKVSQYHGRIETFVTLGRPSPVSLDKEGLELQAVGSPTDLVAGESASFILYLDGTPLQNTEIVVTRGQTRYRDHVDEIKVRTDGKGIFLVTWPEPGMYWLESSFVDQRTTSSLAAERRLSYALTLEIMPN